MRDTRSLVLPALLAGAGLASYALAPSIAERTHLPLGSDGSSALHRMTGVWLWLALAWLSTRLIDLSLQRAAVISRRSTPYPRLLNNLAHTAFFVGACIAILLFVFEQPAAGLITVSSVVIAVVGFALRNVMGDVFSGIALGVEHPYRIGDWIETVQGSAGKVVEISWRTTRLVDRSGLSLVIPNGLVAGNRLINYGNGEHDYRTSLRVPLDPTLPVSRAKRILLSGALDASRAIPGLRPDVLLQEFANEAAVYLVRFHVPDFEREAACRDTVASGVLRALHSAGLEIAHFVPDAFAARPLVPTGQAQRAALLRHVDLFHPLDETERADLASHMAEHLFKTGEVVFRQGDVGDSLWILSEGILDICVESDDGDATIIARIVPGELFGEMSLLTGEPRTASVTAETDAVAYEIRKEQFGPMLRQRPGIADGLATIMAARLATNARRSHDFEMPQRPTPATRDALLGRLRSFFGL